MKYKKNNYNLNVFFADFMTQNDKFLNLDEKKIKNREKEEVEIDKIEEVVKKIVKGNLYEVWKDY